jgi:signal transduction histidine kinase
VPADRTDPAGGPGWWQRMLPWWHVGCAVTIALTAAVTLLTGAPWLVVLPLGLLAVAYLALGRRALRTDAPGRGVAYLLVAAALLAWTVHLHPAGMLLLICLYPQCFAMIDRFVRAAPVAIVITAAGYAASAQHDGWTHGAVVSAGVVGLISVSVALAIGLFVDTIVRESDRRAELVDALTAAQEELAGAHHQAGVHAERERLAREIHDTLAQGFTSIIVLARAIDSVLARATASGPAEDGGVRDKLALLEETAAANLAEARALVAALPPADLHDGGLLGALRRAADRCSRENGLPARLVVHGSPRSLEPSYDVVLLRVAQEALANVAKHSRAQHVVVTMSYAETDTSLEVCDDGVGLPHDVPPGFGLAGMRQRVEAADGLLCVEPTPGGGTTVRVVLP